MKELRQYEIKINLIKEYLSRSRKSKAKTKTGGSAKGLFVLNPEKSLFNGLEIIKNKKNNESRHTDIMKTYFMRNSVMQIFMHYLD